MTQSDDELDKIQARIEADLEAAKALKPPIRRAEAEEPRPAPPIDHADEGGVI
jgi:hypothetical protein